MQYSNIEIEIINAAIAAIVPIVVISAIVSIPAIPAIVRVVLIPAILVLDAAMYARSYRGDNRVHFIVESLSRGFGVSCCLIYPPCIRESEAILLWRYVTSLISINYDEIWFLECGCSMAWNLC